VSTHVRHTRQVLVLGNYMNGGYFGGAGKVLAGGCVHDVLTLTRIGLQAAVHPALA
jgi:hypothetical protein